MQLPILSASATIGPITPGELLDEEFLQPLGVSQYRLAKAIDVPASPIRICASAVFWA